MISKFKGEVIIIEDRNNQSQGLVGGHFNNNDDSKSTQYRVSSDNNASQNTKTSHTYDDLDDDIPF